MSSRPIESFLEENKPMNFVSDMMYFNIYATISKGEMVAKV
jgi:hypothetical protein